VVGEQFNGVPGIRGTVRESVSRTSFDLTGRQDDLIRPLLPQENHSSLSISVTVR
jgi:hypothetical protein